MEAISGFDSGSILFPSTGTVSKAPAKQHQTVSNGDIGGRKGSQDYKHWYDGSRNVSGQPSCRDALCTNYLSRSDMNALFQCQRNATKKMKRLAHGWSRNDTKSPLLVTLHRDHSTGALSSGLCRFVEGEGKVIFHGLNVGSGVRGRSMGGMKCSRTNKHGGGGGGAVNDSCSMQNGCMNLAIAGSSK